MRLISLMTVFVIIAYGAVIPAALAAPVPPQVQTVAKVAPARFMGRWYEIARLPNRFQKGCTGSYTDYSLRDDGQINIVNSCRNEKDGDLRQVKGRAWVVDPASNARLKVTFFWPLRSDYWIIGLGKEYEYAVVASPSRKYLWILSRSATMDDALYAELLQGAERQGFDVKSLIKGIPGNRGVGES